MLPRSHARQRSGRDAQIVSPSTPEPARAAAEELKNAAKLAPSIAWKIVQDAGYDALAVGRRVQLSSYHAHSGHSSASDGNDRCCDFIFLYFPTGPAGVRRAGQAHPD